MINILYAIGHLSKGGAELQCRLLMNNLDPEKYNVSVIYLYEGNNPDIALHVNKFPIIRKSKWGILSLICQVNALVDDIQPDLVHVWLPEIIASPVALAARLKGIPVVSAHRGTMRFNGLAGRGLRNQLRYCQHIFSTRIIANFDISEEPFLFRWLYDHKHGQTVANGIPIEKIQSLPAANLPEEAEYQLVYAGRLAPEKDLETAFQALKRMQDNGWDVHFTLFGEGTSKYEEKLRRMASEIGINNCITFFGSCTAWQSYAKTATALIFPSRGEGTSNVVLEAAAVGLPVIISDIGMSRNMFTHKENSFIVKNRNSIAWEEAIKEVLSDKRLLSSLVEKGRKLAESYSVSAMVEAYEDTYMAVLANEN